MSEVEEKFKRLKQRLGMYDDDSRQEILAWEDTVSEAILMSSAKNNDGVKKIIERYEEDLDNLNHLLMEDKNLIDNGEERRWIFERKRWIQDFLNLFNEKKIENIEKRIDQELN